MKIRILSIVIIAFLLSPVSLALKIYTEDDPPLNFLNENGVLDGYSVEIVREIQKRVGDNSKINLVPWVRGYNIATKAGIPDVLLFTTALTKEREDKFHWIGPIDKTEWYLYGLKDSKFEINKLEDAKKIDRIGTYRDDVQEQMLKSYGFKNLVSSRNNRINLYALISGRIDLWVTSEITLKEITQSEGEDVNNFKKICKVDSRKLYLAFSKPTSKEIVEKWRKVFEEIKLDGTLDKISKKWGMNIQNLYD